MALGQDLTDKAARPANTRSVYQPVYSVYVSHRPLAIVSGLTIGDYLLWNWSLNANHDVLALVSGLTLPPLAIACAWLLALTVARLIARRSRESRRARRCTPRRHDARARWRGRRTSSRPLATAPMEKPSGMAPATTTSQRRTRKIAA